MHTVRFRNELERNITIKLGYANAKVRERSTPNSWKNAALNSISRAQIYKCENPSCERPGSYRSYSSDKEDTPPCEVPGCGGTMKLLRCVNGHGCAVQCTLLIPCLSHSHVSFVDCPGHDILMATMLNGAAVMDAALLLIAANETCPQPQTSEHLAAIEIMKLKHILVLQVRHDR